MNISVNIQSYKRAGNVSTLDIVPSAVVWVHSFEIEEYREAYPNVNIMELPDSTKGNLPRVKNYILDNVDADACLFLDDDIIYVAQWQNKEQKKIESEEDFMDMVIKYSVLCKEWGYKLWGINLNADKQIFREYSPFSTLSYVSSSFACFLKDNELRYDESFPLKEDYDMTIQQCNKYRGLLRINSWFYYKKSAENVGGCAVYRNVDKEVAQLKLLQKKWGSSIVKKDMGKSRSHSTKKVRKYDINPIILIPIKGI